MKKLLVILTLLLSFSMTNTTQASHIVGGDVSFKQIGPNQFKVTMRFFRFCTGIGTPSSATFRLFDNVTNANISSFTMNRDSIVTLSFGDECYTPTGLCVQVSYYSATVTIANNPNGYYCTYTTGGRNSGLKNLVSGSSTWTCQIPDPAIAGRNSSPVFVQYPSDGYFCVDHEKDIDFSCTDSDGDSLSYTLETPYNGTTGTPFGSRPFRLATYRATFSNPFFLGPGATISIDNKTGIVTALPRQLGIYVLAVKCEEYRNGVKIGEVFRDLQYAVLNCKFNTLPKFKERVETETLKFDKDGCFDVVAYDVDNDTFFIGIESNAFAYGATAGLPTSNSSGLYDFSWIDSTTGLLDTVNNVNVKKVAPNKFQGVGRVGIRFCWNLNNCEALEIDTFRIKVFGFSIGCDASIDSVERNYKIIIDQGEYSHVVPNVFSPNGDNKNDVFKLAKDQYDRCYDALTVRIYNRWGQNVYESDDAKFEWDGRDSNGADLSEGTYYVVLQGYYGGRAVTDNFPITLFR